MHAVLPMLLMRAGMRRVRQKPKMEIVLTKSADFDIIVAGENEANAADSGQYDGESMCHMTPSSCNHPPIPAAHDGHVRSCLGNAS